MARVPRKVPPCEMCGTLGGKPADRNHVTPSRLGVVIEGRRRMLCFRCRNSVYKPVTRGEITTWSALVARHKRLGAGTNGKRRDDQRERTYRRINKRNEVKEAYLSLIAQGIYPSALAVIEETGCDRSTVQKYMSILKASGEIPKIGKDHKLQTMNAVVYRHPTDRARLTPPPDIKTRESFYRRALTAKEPRNISIFVDSPFIRDMPEPLRVEAVTMNDDEGPDEAWLPKRVETLVSVYDEAWSHRWDGLKGARA